MSDADGERGGVGEIAYARADLERVAIERVDGGGVLVRVPPMGAGVMGVRLVVWGVGLGVLGGNLAYEAGLPVPRLAAALVLHLGLLPLPARAVLAGVCAVMVYRIVRYRGAGARVGFDGERVFVENPTGLMGRRVIGLERVWGVLARDSVAGAETWLTVVLRDGVTARVLIGKAEETRAAREALEAAMGPAAVMALRVRGKPDRSWTGRQWEWVPKDWPRVAVDEFADGVRVTFTGSDGWMGLAIVRAGFLCWLTVASLSVAGVAAPAYWLLQWSALYAVAVFGLYAPPIGARGEPQPLGGQRPRPAIDVVGGRVFLMDPSYRGRENGWGADEVAGVGVGGPLWWVLRVGALVLRLKNGKRVTLAYGYPIPVVREAAGVIRRGMGMAGKTGGEVGGSGAGGHGRGECERRTSNVEHRTPNAEDERRTPSRE